ncbi:MAG: saccharopine dehydrogenase NADP-binding domain-containing protein [Bacteroidetes bacterium]|nr:saccharopine dehydrogenase NADP-binding domain-containing protein [Bacteroidota bacterium]
MTNILLLGAGLVARPLVKYLLEQKFNLTIADKDLARATEMVGNNPNGTITDLDVNDTKSLSDLIKKHDLVISLLPYTFHYKVAGICLEHKKHMVTTSYVSAEMRALHPIARDKGILLLNEIGVDPGTDHMSAMKVIDTVKAEGGKIVSFESVTGGLPAPESNDNPFGYKFSWSPRGVILAGRNNAQYIKDGKHIEIEGKDLFNNYWSDEVKGLGTLEVYPNRDSILYRDLYDLHDAKTVFRGTYRNPGWCQTLYNIAKLGYLNLDENESLHGKTMAELTAMLIGKNSTEDILRNTAAFLGIDAECEPISKMNWLGLFDDLAVKADFPTYLDMLAKLMNNKMQYAAGEQDMIVMKHKFIAEYTDGKQKEITSTMINKGIPNGDSSMARTVSLPAAIGAEMIAKGVIKKAGVFIPIQTEFYNPILKKLETMDIKFIEEEKVL